MKVTFAMLLAASAISVSTAPTAVPETVPEAVPKAPADGYGNYGKYEHYPEPKGGYGKYEHYKRDTEFEAGAPVEKRDAAPEAAPEANPTSYEYYGKYEHYPEPKGGYSKYEHYPEPKGGYGKYSGCGAYKRVKNEAPVEA